MIRKASANRPAFTEYEMCEEGQTHRENKEKKIKRRKRTFRYMKKKTKQENIPMKCTCDWCVNGRLRKNKKLSKKELWELVDDYECSRLREY